MAKRYELNDQQWARIADKVPGKKGDPGRSGKDSRLFVNGVLWVLRSGALWRQSTAMVCPGLPACRRGVFRRLFLDGRNDSITPVKVYSIL